MGFIAPLVTAVAPALIGGVLQKKAATSAANAQIESQERIAQSQLAAQQALEQRKLDLQEQQLKIQAQQAEDAAKIAAAQEARRQELAAFAPVATVAPIQQAPAVAAPPADNTGLLLALLMQNRQTETPAPPVSATPTVVQPTAPTITTFLPYIALAGVAILLITQRK